MTDYLQICLDLSNTYKHKVEEALIKQGMTKGKADEIIEALDLDRELIFSLNRTYEKALTLNQLCTELPLNSELPKLFKMKWELYSHQVDAIRSIYNDTCTVISSGTGSGKTESFLIPIVNYCIENERINGLKAIIVYPMNALAGDQLRRLREVLSGTKIKYAIFNGETPENSIEKDANTEICNNEILTRNEIVNQPPDILVTNYVMLDRIMTNPNYSKLIDLSVDTLKYVVLDEIHTYRGNKGLHIRGLIGRLKSKINCRLVLIGCSATLRNDGKGRDGYISSDRDTFIESFIKRLFWLDDNDQYKYIEPVYEIPKKSLNNPDPTDYISIRDSEKTKTISNFLESGPKSLSEIFDLLKNKSLINNKSQLLEYFRTVMNLTLKYPNIAPVLDFRVHIFLLKISGILSRCIDCGKFYSGIISTCIECGGATLPINKFEPDHLIGILNNSEIMNPLTDSQFYTSDDPVVFVNFNPENYKAVQDRYRIGRLNQAEKGLKIKADKAGKYELILADNLKVDELDDYYINFEEEGKEEYISYLIKALMLSLVGQDKKLLSFIDNREKVGRYNVLIGDALLSDFFYETLKYVNMRDISISDLRIEWMNSLREALDNNQNINTEQKKCILNDAEIWFVRFLRLGKEKREILPCNENLYSGLKPYEKEILSIAIEESCFKYDIRSIVGDVIKVDRAYIEHPRGIGLQSNNANSISLSDSGIKYKNIITKYPLEFREKALANLLDMGILKASQSESRDVDPTTIIYFLNESKFKLTIDKSFRDNLSEIVDNEVLFVDAHSSEIPKLKKKIVEAKLQNAETNVVFATPTLEMGIDIGELTYIMMIGVPPAPSNYAQRVGRAGRRKSRFAASIAICSPSSSHDWYYYHDPKAMIDGMISPPKFDEKNKNIIKKHITATLPLDTISAIKSNKWNYINNSVIKERYINRLDSEISATDFLGNLQIKLDKLNSRTVSINNLYDKGILPDYGFSKDEIDFIDIENGDTIASRSVDLAFREVIPGKREFIGERYYEFLEIHNHSFETYDGNTAEEVEKVYCQRKDHVITRSYEGRNSESFVAPNPHISPKKIIKRGPLILSLLKDTELHFININKTQRLGYRLNRDVIKIELDSRVVTDNQYYSLIAALDRGLKDYCGLDESELTWVLNHDVRIVNSVDNEKLYALLYEKSGTGDIDFESIIDDIGKWNHSNILQDTFSRIRNCGCDKETGCYLCMRSYATQRFISYAHKKIAENFIGYLIGERKFDASPKWESHILKYDSTIVLSKKGDQLVLEDGLNKKVCLIQENENHDIMKELTLLLVELYKNEDVETIQFIAKQEHILNAINGTGKLKDSHPWFNKFKFHKAAFREVLAEKG